MKFYLVRHGKASQFAPSDETRLLLPEGVEHIERLGLVLAKMGIKPDKIYASPRLRAQETAAIIAKALGMDYETHDYCNFSFDAKHAFKLVESMDEEAEIMFVGHNPSISDTVTELTGAQVDMNVGGIACITRLYPPRTDGILRWLLNPKTVLGLAGDD